MLPAVFIHSMQMKENFKETDEMKKKQLVFTVVSIECNSYYELLNMK